MANLSSLRLQVVLLTAILILATGALFHRIFLFETPAPTIVDWTKLSFPNYTFRILEKRSEKADRVYARGTAVSFLISAGGVDGIRLEVGLVHSRESDTFEVTKMTQGQAGITLDDAKTKASPLLRDSQLLIGTVDGKAAVQTCVIENSASAVGLEKLIQLREATRVRSARETFRQILGLRDNIRWECALVTVKSMGSGTSPEELELIFSDLFWPIRHLYESSTR